ncbi:trigger factor [Holdemania massiliensis]|uniref:trigger factor n=1 Tax=Holdemania massiliensis TaxID=1468449 RepID=UPI001F069C59|nr:trigger factor [Holdemania massiliensis]MCH1941005.1 trigger factor [Holdemania massiliensis]
MSTWTLKEKSTGELKVTIEGENWKTAQKKAFNKLAKELEIPGFRKGSVPAAMAKKYVPAQKIMLEAVEHCAQDLLDAGIDEHSLWPISRPELNIEEISEEAATMSFTFAVKPEVKLGEYKGLAYEVAETSVSEEEVDAELKRIQENFAELEVKEEGEVENGDTAVIDFEGFKDGVAFEGGKGENYPLEIGSNSFIPGFEEQVIGMKKEETKDINVTFPENYQAAELAGQPVVFKVTVHEIKAKVLPELNDDLAKDVNAPNVETMEDLKALIRKNQEEQKQQNAENEATNKLISTVVDACEVEIPEIMIKNETDDMIQDYANRLQQQGISLQQFFQITGQSEETLREQMAKDAESKVKLRLVLDAVATQENLEVGEEDIDTEYGLIASQYNMEKDKVKELIPASSISYDVRLRKALDLIKDSTNK